MRKSFLYILFVLFLICFAKHSNAQDPNEETVNDTTITNTDTDIENNNTNTQPTVIVNPEVYVKQDSAISEEKKQTEKFKKQIAQQDSAMAKKKREMEMEKRNFEQKKKLNAEENAMIQAKKRQAAAERAKKIAAMRELKQKIYANSKIQITEILNPENENGNIEAIVDEKRVEIKFNMEKAVWEIVNVFKDK